MRSETPEEFFNEEIRRVLEISADGLLVNKISEGKRKQGALAGWTPRNGYTIVRLTFKGIRRTFMAHRVIWFLTHGTWPEEIDHRDRSKKNNKPTNLRPATRSQNTARRVMPERELPRGVVDASHTNKKNPFMAQCGNKYIGYFPTPESAHEAFKTEHLRLYGKEWNFE